MSLLTQKQLEEIQTFHDDIGECTFPHEECFIKELIEWNKKQTAQIEIDWSKAPDSTVSAVAHLAWIDEDGYLLPGYEIASFERPVTPHPHAEMMAKYAEVAARRVDPWVEFEQYSYCDEDWFTLEVPTFFDAHLEYRYIGDAK